ncbi:ATP-dependent RNA helicase SrmB [Marinomonas aquimarina]|uniref:ATP-dependent RNA helicase SrmB n=1 Tax=Marinomonas aquimarina TaxID=295068 RepID=A0A1A8TN60_9GAMM|nr:DEAD/DEAH box helicase [Marinomonas aquimarina]SBS35233.1 ATP-dependent RNA helicase SrmB [Marinomonas aquimarina]
MSFSELDLDFTITQAIEDMGLSEPTPIQEQAIPLAMDAQDILACAATGTGKTLAFAAPVVQHILDRDEESSLAPKALVLAPSRELARQIFQVFEQVIAHTRIKLQLIVGGTPYGMQQQQLSEPCDILVATPGRLVELDEKGWLDFSDCSMFVIDEADRMLDMGFIDAVRHLAKQLPKEHQTLMFSATIDGEKMSRFSRSLLNEDAETIQLTDSPRTVPSQIKQVALRVDDDAHKEALLKHLISQERVQQAVVFVSNRDHVDVWVQRIRKWGFRCDGLHGEMKQSDRNDHLKQMKKGRLQVLVATDVAARGIDLPEINTVINLRLPRRADSYVHRAGRASREGNPGECYSLVDMHDLPMIEKIQRYMQAHIAFSKIEGLEPKTKIRAASAAKTKKKPAAKKKTTAAKVKKKK